MTEPTETITLNIEALSLRKQTETPIDIAKAKKWPTNYKLNKISYTELKYLLQQNPSLLYKTYEKEMAKQTTKNTVLHEAAENIEPLVFQTVLQNLIQEQNKNNKPFSLPTERPKNFFHFIVQKDLSISLAYVVQIVSPRKRFLQDVLTISLMHRAEKCSSLFYEIFNDKSLYQETLLETSKKYPRDFYLGLNKSNFWEKFHVDFSVDKENKEDNHFYRAVNQLYNLSHLAKTTICHNFKNLFLEYQDNITLTKEHVDVIKNFFQSSLNSINKPSQDYILLVEEFIKQVEQKYLLNETEHLIVKPKKHINKI